MEKITVFGATGGTGLEVVRQALEKGHEVTVVVRNGPTLQLIHPNLKIVTGNILQPMTFEKEIAGQDVVISCLGTGTSTKPTSVYSQGMENIISFMEKKGTKRLICITAGALEVNNDMGFLIRPFTKYILQRILKDVYADMALMETKIEVSQLDWTIMRPARLTNKDFSGKYRIAIDSHISWPFSIARADLAAYMLKSIKDQKTYYKKIEIAY